MKMKLIMQSVVLALAFCAVIHTAPAQGPLAPAGAPAAVMKSLDQVEPRTPISYSPYPITQAGSYYLTTNLLAQTGENGINVDADNVAIDLNGFALIGCTGSLSGIDVMSSAKNVTIRNGVIRNWGQYGVDARFANGIVLENIVATTNGYEGSAAGLSVGSDCVIIQCLAWDNYLGIWTGNRCLVADSNAARNQSRGIFTDSGCSITRSLAISNRTDGIVVAKNCMVVDTSSVNNNGNGIETRSGSLISRSMAIGNNGQGIAAGDGSTVRDCNSSTNTGEGIWVSSGCYVKDNHCDNNMGAGIQISGRECRVEDNNVSNNGSGLDVDGDRNFIVRNSARDNSGLNYVVATGNRMGIIAVPPLSGSISGDSSTNALGVATTDPWANFSY